MALILIVICTIALFIQAINHDYHQLDASVLFFIIIACCVGILHLERITK